MNELEKNEALGDLYAYYGKLLTQSQQDYFEDYYYNDLSLGEIADNHGVSRQAIYDNLRRCRKLLANYEAKLHLKREFGVIEAELTDIANSLRQDEPDQAMHQIDELLSRMRGE
ncbi:YlxM family DNA-binding protein [Lactobacillus xylocopicola]|uniref:UPF0122 protein KIM322_09190 n=1 Tax=Lactobacillus xylocopicola TaxID=2976676 RepID=A0ABM8BH93_9LACO|nr:transcriptional regulator [Lactobacillus xylocopicola]BDR60658.1 UPF0122 protein [Lactobacillus xylocopicola]